MPKGCEEVKLSLCVSNQVNVPAKLGKLGLGLIGSRWVFSSMNTSMRAV
jgi:hypothetical protein